METPGKQYNVTMNDGAVVVVKPLDKTCAIVYTAAYLVFGPNYLYLSEFVRQPINSWGMGWNLAITALITAVWLYLMAGLRMVTWIEPWATSVRRRNLFFFSSSVPYERIARIGTAKGSGPFAGGVHFVLVDKTNPLGKGFALTRRMDPAGPEFAYFNATALPAINTVIFGAADGPGLDAEEAAAVQGVPPERLGCYRKSGKVFTRRRSFHAWLAYAGAAFFLMAALFMFLYGIIEDNAPLTMLSVAAFVMGLVVLLYGAACIAGFSIDTETGEILLASWFGKRVRRIPLDESVKLEAERSYGNFMYMGTRLLVRYQTKLMNREYVLGSGHFSTKGLAGIDRETRLLLTAAHANRRRSEGKEPGASPFLATALTRNQDVAMP